MKKLIAIVFTGVAGCTAALAQQTGMFVFNNSTLTPNATSQVFTANGFGMTVSGLESGPILDQTQSTVSLVAGAESLALAYSGGLGAGPYSTGQLQNGGGINPISPENTVLELSNFTAPGGRPWSDLFINTQWVHPNIAGEGFLVYGSAGDATSGNPTQLTLLDHGFLNASGQGGFDVSSSLFSQYSTFYVTADNNYHSTIALAGGTYLQTSATPEPLSCLGFAVAGVPFLLRRRKKSKAA